MGERDQRRRNSSPTFLCWRIEESAFRDPLDNSGTALDWPRVPTHRSLSIWSPLLPIAAAKLVGNMAGVLLTIIVLEKAARAGILNANVLALLITSSLLLGVVQTYYFGGTQYGYDGPDEPSRFSSFVWAQQYAAILVAFLAVTLWNHEFSSAKRWLLITSISAALVLNGSRTWFIGAVFVLVVYSWIRFRRVATGVVFAASSVYALRRCFS